MPPHKVAPFHATTVEDTFLSTIETGKTNILTASFQLM